MGSERSRAADGDEHAKRRRREGGEASQQRGMEGAVPAHALVKLGGVVGNGAVNRLLDGFYPKKDKVKVPVDNVRFVKAFTGKHVADDAAGAEAVTKARVAAGKAPPSMVAGTLGNTVAPLENWERAVDASEDVMPDNPRWAGGLAVKVDGWQVKYKSADDTATASALGGGARSIGGKMSRDGKVDVDHVGGA